ncbi:hypothetical protein P879_11739 [Paragonimus westermani]|uniref:Cilia- and flagella-associated protein 43 n=1 Tax=Paragonimus westermani TaxID=34504 RepID=A0A8T0D5U8_9TREM|nr:hypothetical protein P879_11739 [Paragonimus westermani]
MLNISVIVFLFRWTQGCKGFQVGYLDNHILCVRSGPAVRLHNLDDGTYKVFQFHTHALTTLAVHPLGTYFAVAELHETDPKVFVYEYPDLNEKILRGSGKLELRQVTFSASSYLATVSGIPDFLLSLWDFKQGLLLCQARLNGSLLNTISFCPTDWRWIVATDNRCLHVWRVETCDQITLLRCRSMVLPVQSVPLGFYKEQTSERDLFSDPEKSTTRFDPVLPESAITGIGTDRRLEFLDYLDETDRVICVSQTWSNTEILLIGCKYGELLLFDPSSLVIKVLLNPLSYQRCAKGSTDRMLDEGRSAMSSSCASIPKPNSSTTNGHENTESFAIPFGCFSFLLYTKHGVFCAGRDGVLRLLKLGTSKPNVPIPVRNSELITSHGLPPSANTRLLRVSVEACRKLFTCINPFHIGDEPGVLRITGMAVSPSYGRLTLCSRAGQLIGLNIADNVGLLEPPVLPEKQLTTSGDSFVGLGLLGPEKKTVCAVCHVIETTLHCVLI